MNIEPEILALHTDMRQWRRQFHQYPETAFEETGTAHLICEQLQQYGIETHQGLATPRRQYQQHRPARRYGCAVYSRAKHI
jgi:metal-dependent amidase/aminoacylase/carboxypeptidase family protein